LGSIGGILSWDQETMMPPQGVEHRSVQLALLARTAHEAASSPRIGDLLSACEADREFMASCTIEAANVREMRRDFDRLVRLPAAHVAEFAALTAKSQHAWVAARGKSNYAEFEPWLRKIVNLSRERAQLLGVPQGGEAWDALADAYEPDCTAVAVDALFVPLRKRLAAFIAEIAEAKRRPSNRFNEHALPIETQARFVRMVVETIGFDFTRGRLDTSAHPFCGGSHCDDVRLTTRYSATCLNDALGSSMHEAGHGMYEQGLPNTDIGLPSGTAISLAIHESQSRLWENQVGRSHSFWKWCAPKVAEWFGSAGAGFGVDELYGAANVVEPGFIRVDADEATYNLHVMIRFELERLLISGSLDTGDLPGEWNRRYKEYLGLVVPDDRRGCLQDVHWSMGAIGYFPTYTLGTIYSAQFFDAARRALPEVETGFAKGEFAPLKAWLNREIHSHGRRYGSEELCRRVTGQKLSVEPYFAYLEGKLRPLYGI
jgi:carboxypeptidase Taq